MNNPRIKVEYGAVSNANTYKGGWLPVIRVNGKQYGDTWSSKAFDRDQATELARHAAVEEASKFVGCWEVTIEFVPLEDL